MEDLDESIFSTKFEPLFIKEEEVDPDRTLMEQRECNMAQSGLTFTGTELNQSALIKPYLQEMDDLLESCEKLTAIPFSSRFSASLNETRLTESTNCQSQEEDTLESNGEKSISSQEFPSTSYIDTHMGEAATEDQQAQAQSQGLGTIINRCGVSKVSCQREMPLTSAGHKLSDTMVEYEGQLLGMLAMLESCIEEAGMDFEPRAWTSDASQEYVHITKRPHHCRGATLVPVQQEREIKLKTQSMQPESWAGQRGGGDELSQENGNDTTKCSSTIAGQQNPVVSCGDMCGFSMERLEKQDNLKTNEMVCDPHFGFSDLSKPVERTGNPMQHEVPQTGHISTNAFTNTKGDGTATEVDNAEMSAEEGNKPKVVFTDLGSGISDLGALGSQMDECIEEVQQLEKRRKDLLAEVLELRGNTDKEQAERRCEEDTEESIDRKVVELINVLQREEERRREERKRDIQGLREDRAVEERRMWKVNLERQGLQEELRKLKRRLFATARDCAHSQFALNTQHREMELLKREEEKLQSLVLQLTEEVSQLSTASKQQILDLQAEIPAQSSSQTSNTQDELTQCRRHSCTDFQQYLQGGLRTLEDRYEPILLALLKRREVTAEALVKAKEQAQGLRSQLRPLKEEVQKLKLQRACLEEKLKLSHIQRREDMGQYKEVVYGLEESTRELKTELKIQKRKSKEMKELRDSLSKQLLLYRAAAEGHDKSDEEKT